MEQNELQQSQTNSKRHWSIRYAPITIVSIAFVLLAWRLFDLISRYAVNIFFYDQWDFNTATLFQEHSLWQMFTWQHGPHRQGLGALFEKLIEPAFGWNSRTESFVVGGIILVAAVCALYLKKRLYGRLSFFDVIIPALIFIPAQYETLFVTANFAHGPFPLLLIILYCLAWTCRANSIRYSLILVINFVTIYTGFGLLLGFITPCALLLDYLASPAKERIQTRYLIAILWVSVLSFASFFLAYRFDPAIDCFSPSAKQPKYYLAYMAFMLSNFFAVRGIGTPQLIAGLAILSAFVILLAIMIRQLWSRSEQRLPKQARDSRIVSAVLIAFCLLFCAGTAYGRVCGGLWTSRASRYVIYLETGVLGAYFYVLTIRDNRIRNTLAVGLLLAVLGASSNVDRYEMGYFPSIKLRWKRCYFMNEDARFCDQLTGFPIYPHDEKSTHLEQKLEFLRSTRQNLYADAK